MHLPRSGFGFGDAPRRQPRHRCAEPLRTVRAGHTMVDGPANRVLALTSNHTLPTVPELSQAYWILDSLYAAFCVSLLSVASFADWSELASLAAAPGSQVEAGKPAEREALLPSEPPVETSRKEA